VCGARDFSLYLPHYNIFADGRQTVALVIAQNDVLLIAEGLLTEANGNACCKGGLYYSTVAEG
jgi:hypothetical protein